MYSSHEDTSENYPEIGCRTIGRTHDGTEDRAKTGYVEKLDDEDLPCGHRCEVNSILKLICRSLSLRIDIKISGNILSIKDVPCNKKQDRDDESDHFGMILNKNSTNLPRFCL